MRRIVKVIKPKPDLVNIQTDKTGFYPVPVRRKLDELCNTFHWIKLAPDGVLEFFCDHHILSTLRTCETKFQEEIVNNIIPRAGNWSLHFGSTFHTWMEWFDEAEDKHFTGVWNQYKPQSDSNVNVLAPGSFTHIKEINVANWITRCHDFWVDNNLEQYKDEKGFNYLEGWSGAQNLLLHYWNKYSNGNERLRTVGSEISFGRDKEVPLLLDAKKYWYAPFRCFLTGRIDRVVDNGRVIGPLDRKTHVYFKGKEASKYKPHDAFLGYIYSLNKVMAALLDKEHKPCNSIIVDMIALKDPGPKAKIQQRFIRASRDFGPAEMSAFIDRQISSFSMLYEILVLGRPTQWNTMSCHNQYYKDCPYKLLHEVSPEGRNGILQGFYKQREERWSPYKAEQAQENDILAEG